MKSWPTKKLGETSDKEIENKVKTVILQLFKNDEFLLKGKVNKRSVAHKLAEYLQQQFPEWHVDCEYNRHGIEIKKVQEKRVYPDIIVHHRNTDENLLVIEIKCSNDDNAEDIEKLQKFTDSRGKFKYQLGLFSRIVNEELKEILWFKTGQQKKLGYAKITKTQ